MRDKIVYMPYPIKGNKINEYLSNMVKILQDEYQVLADLAESTNLLQMLQTKAVFLNWTENQDQFNTKMKVQLILHKLLGAKIIWVFHNKCPHDIDCKNKNISVLNMRWLARHSSIILLHSKSSKKYIPDAKQNMKKAVYVPHVMYEQQNKYADLNAVRQKYGIAEEDFVFTMFGRIRPYKNIEGGIEAFQSLQLKNAKLLIAGSPSDNSYAEKIITLCKQNGNILLDLHYISNAMLDNIIELSDVIVIPYHDGSSMNSGVMIQAFSKGRTVITPALCMAKDMAGDKFFYMYRSSLRKAMMKAYRNGKVLNRRMGEQAREYMYRNNSKEIVKKQIYKMLAK